MAHVSVRDLAIGFGSLNVLRSLNVGGSVASTSFSVRLDADDQVPLDTEQTVYFRPALASLFDEQGNRL